ncbi:MAG: lysophospholipid acyltransferase family protein, partial [Bacteroidota bacterium]|nr:lysophospholipid acyltransferase family protein [Bacteroidota bacterium]
MNLIFNHIQILIIFSITVFSALLAGLFALFSAKLSFWIAKNCWARTICFVSRCQIVAEGLNELKNLNESAIFCSNHLSSFDIIAMYMSLDRPIFFIAKKEIKQIPFLGWYMSVAGMIFLDRSNHENAMRSMRNAGNEIKKGKNIISFPEGTRSKTNQIGQFKRGSFIIAKEGKIPIVPVAIKG